MRATNLTADLSYAILTRIVVEICEPVESLGQCDLFLRAAGMLRRRVPEEADHSGERIRARDLLNMIEEARRALDGDAPKARRQVTEKMCQATSPAHSCTPETAV